MKTYCIASAIIKGKDGYLIAKRAETKTFAPGQWEFISGFIDDGEAAEDTIIREIKEELGVGAKIIGTADPCVCTDNEGRWIIVPFSVELTSEQITLLPKDHSQYKWVPSQELSTYPDLQGVASLKTKGLIEN